MKLEDAGLVGQVAAGNVVVVAATTDVLGSADHATQVSEEELEEVEVVVGPACQELELVLETVLLGGSVDHGPQEVVDEVDDALEEELGVVEIEGVTLELEDEELRDELDEEPDDEAELLTEELGPTLEELEEMLTGPMEYVLDVVLEIEDVLDEDVKLLVRLEVVDHELLTEFDVVDVKVLVGLDEEELLDEVLMGPTGVVDDVVLLEELEIELELEEEDMLLEVDDEELLGMLDVELELGTDDVVLEVDDEELPDELKIGLELDEDVTLLDDDHEELLKLLEVEVELDEDEDELVVLTGGVDEEVQLEVVLETTLDEEDGCWFPSATGRIQEQLDVLCIAHPVDLVVLRKCCLP